MNTEQASQVVERLISLARIAFLSGRPVWDPYTDGGQPQDCREFWQPAIDGETFFLQMLDSARYADIWDDNEIHQLILDWEIGMATGLFPDDAGYEWATERIDWLHEEAEKGDLSANRIAAEADNLAIAQDLAMVARGVRPIR